ncbi:MAG: sugar kinase [Candidatus Pelethousia sp.]|nr:sugar kinase [Candidatus Pelethousia sp.]
MEKKKFVGFGEMLLRLAPDGYLRLSQANNFNLNYTGAEGNMAIALSYMGLPAALVTKLPDNELGRCTKRMLCKFEVDTSHIAWGGERLGLYYLERGASQRPSKVIYDRKGSAFAEAEPGDFDWDEIFRDAGWFHFTGITVALSANLREICRQACIAARRHGVKVSVDLNYRKSLWTPQEAQLAMRPLMEYVDVCIANEEDSEKSLGVKAADTDISAGRLSIEGYCDLAKKLADAYGFEKVAITLRESISASINNWSALLYADGQAYLSRKYTLQIVDRVGGGDSFASGLIYACLHDFENQKAVEFAAAASCLKHSIEFDFNLSSPQEVMALINGDGSGRVQR